MELWIEVAGFSCANQAVYGSGKLIAAVGRQSIMPEVWRAKSLLPTRFILWPNSASLFLVNTSTMALCICLFQRGWNYASVSSWMPLQRQVR